MDSKWGATSARVFFENILGQGLAEAEVIVGEWGDHGLEDLVEEPQDPGREARTSFSLTVRPTQSSSDQEANMNRVVKRLGYMLKRQVL